MMSIFKKIGRLLGFRKTKGKYVVDNSGLTVGETDDSADCTLRMFNCFGNLSVTESLFGVTKTIKPSAQSVCSSEAGGLHMKHFGSTPIFDELSEASQTSDQQALEFFVRMLQKKKDVFELQPSVARPLTPIPKPRYTTLKASDNRQPPVPAPRLSLLKHSKNQLTSVDILHSNCVNKIPLRCGESGAGAAVFLYSPSVVKEINSHFDDISPVGDTSDPQPTCVEAKLVDEDYDNFVIRL